MKNFRKTRYVCAINQEAVQLVVTLEGFKILSGGTIFCIQIAQRLKLLNQRGISEAVFDDVAAGECFKRLSEQENLTKVVDGHAGDILLFSDRGDQTYGSKLVKRITNRRPAHLELFGEDIVRYGFAGEEIKVKNLIQNQIISVPRKRVYCRFHKR